VVKAPLDWYLYISHPPADGDWRTKTREFKQHLAAAQRAEIETFLRSAQNADESDLYIIESEELDEKLLLDPGEGGSIRSIWAQHLHSFLE
jgi:hypothetical protein